MRQWGVNNLPKVVAQQRHGRGSNPPPMSRKSDALTLSHCATPDCGTFGGTKRLYIFQGRGSAPPLLPTPAGAHVFTQSKSENLRLSNENDLGIVASLSLTSNL